MVDKQDAKLVIKTEPGTEEEHSLFPNAVKLEFSVENATVSKGEPPFIPAAVKIEPGVKSANVKPPFFPSAVKIEFEVDDVLGENDVKVPVKEEFDTEVELGNGKNAPVKQTTATVSTLGREGNLQAVENGVLIPQKCIGHLIPCSRCEKQFISVYFLEKHTTTVHKIKKPLTKFVCNLCKECFPSHSLLKKHVRSIRRENVVCEICKVKFPTSLELNKHYDLHWLQYKDQCK